MGSSLPNELRIEIAAEGEDCACLSAFAPRGLSVRLVGSGASEPGEGRDGLVLSAREAAERSGSGFETPVLALAETDDPLRDRLLCAGILCCTREELPAVFPQFLAACVRFRAAKSRSESLERRLDDTRIVNRAKLLLMSRLNMSESQAHRYLEKTAMDAGEKKREVAERIIRIYEE